MLGPRLDEIQQALGEAGLDGWLFACFQHNDPVSLQFLGLSGDKLVTRRCYYLVPQQGEAKKLVHALEPAMLDHLPGDKSVYLTWQEHAASLERLVSGCSKLAAQYSPGNELPSVSRLDAGTAERLRELGITLTTSAELVQRFAAVWNEAQLAGHREACRDLHEIAWAAFDRVGEALRAGKEDDEYAVQQFILHTFVQRGLRTESPPIVAVNAHSADPHYQPSYDRSSPIRRGDFLLIDLWAKQAMEPQSVYADITWCGVCAEAPTERQAEIFGIVARARDAAFERVARSFPRETVRGFEVDDAAREVIRQAGYGDKFIHRTGHSIDVSDHGQGANMDNLETHDTRPLIPRTGFSIEPGIYLTGDFGVRSEINVALTDDGAEITGAEPQRELIRVLG